MRLRPAPTLALATCLALGCGADESVENVEGGPATSDTTQMDSVSEGTDTLSLPPTTTDTRQVTALVEDYFAAIDRGDYAEAYTYWAGEGTTSGQSLDEFSRGFAQTASVHVDIGELGRVEGAAGSRYVRIPVTIHAETTTGGHQQFDGTLTLRRSVVPGATEAQRSWRIHSADVEEVVNGDIESVE